MSNTYNVEGNITAKDKVKKIMAASKYGRFVDSRPQKAEDYRRAHTPIMRDSRKIGRNEPCPCGSGKKFKKCHLGK